MLLMHAARALCEITNWLLPLTGELRLQAVSQQQLRHSWQLMRCKYQYTP
jgi:hypothetical protein